LLLLLLIGILAGVAVVNFSGEVHPKEISPTLHAVAAVVTALDAYARDCGQYPTSGQGLKALVTDPCVSGWTGPYIRPLPLDGWQRELRYDTRKEHPQVRSAGRDGKFDTADDIWSP
jgi:general secretion pathway protein G